MNSVKTYSNRHGRVFQSQPHHVFERSGAGIYQVNNLRYLRSQVPQARRIVDVGANVGICTMEYATWARHVEAFESQPETYQLLVHNVNHNRGLPLGRPWYQNATTEITGEIRCHATALMHQAGQAWTTLHKAGLSSFVRFDQGTTPCEARTLDSYDWRDVDAIKIDTEGTEWLVVQGADRTIRRCRPVVQVEMWGWERRFGIDNGDMLAYFRDLGYRQTDAHGTPVPWTARGQWTRRLSGTRSAMDRFFLPQ